MFGGGYEEPKEVRALYEKVGRHFVNGTGGNILAPTVAPDQVTELRRQIEEMRTDIANLRMEVASMMSLMPKKRRARADTR